MKFPVEPDAKGFSARLRQLLEQRSLSQNALAEIAGVRQSTVHRWLTGTLPMPSMAQFLAVKLNVSHEWLMYGDDFSSSVVREDSPVAPPRKTPVDPIELRLRYILGNAPPAVMAIVRRVIDEAYDQITAEELQPRQSQTQSQSQPQYHT